MSLEQAIAENTAAIRELILLFGRERNLGADGALAPAAESKPAVRRGAKAADAPAPTAAPAPAPTAAPAPTGYVFHDKSTRLVQVQDLAVAVSKKFGLPAARELLQKYGVARASEVPEASYVEFANEAWGLTNG